MDMDSILLDAEERMEKAIAALEREFSRLRTGRASASLVDGIKVDYYGTPTPLTQLANISAPEPRLLQISLWDTKMLSTVEKAILKSDLGLTPSNDGKIIRLVLPDLTEERRKELTKVVRKNAEEAKVAVRAIRRDAMEQFKRLKKDSAITEDDQKKAEEDIQKLTDAAVKDIDKICSDKEKEILDVR